jgi:chemotaxis protein CheY-P-specific phosphatase CheC
MTPTLTADEHDAFYEICNIAMGRAGGTLAMFLDHVVELSVPDVAILDVDEVWDFLRELESPDQMTTLVRQSFYGPLSGEVIACHTRSPADDMALVLGYDRAGGGSNQREFILDLSSLLCGAVVSGIGEQLGMEVGFSAPTPVASLDEFQPSAPGPDFAWSTALVSRVRLGLQGRRFTSQIVSFFPDRSFETMSQAVDRFLEEFAT